MKDTHMNFSQLHCFVALDEIGSFTEAAHTLGLTQSTVSHALTDLEHELGVTLLERNSKGVVALTSTGKKIIPHVRALLAQAGAIEQEAKAAYGESSGKLRLGSVFSFCPDLLASVLTCFRAAYPDIEVVLFEGSLQEVVEWIGSSVVDVGFVLHPAYGIESTLITTDELCVLVPSEHHLRTRMAVTIKELRKEALIMAKTGCAFQVMEMAGIKPSEIKPSIRYQASDSATILAMVREELGITLLPRMMLPKKPEGMVALPLDPPHHLQIGLAVRSHKMASRSVELFIQTALAWTKEPASPLPRTR
jgi:DNA-binding transcriptional LysR family regulator